MAQGDRLLSANRRRFAYDEHGNRMQESRPLDGVEIDYSYGPDNQLVEVAETSKNRVRLTWFGYDALGRRIWKDSVTASSLQEAKKALKAQEDQQDTAAIPPLFPTSRPRRHINFLWNGDVLLAESEEETDPLEAVYLFEPGTFRPLAQVRREAPDLPAETYHYHLDHLGTPQEMTNDRGEVVWAADLKAWGTVRMKFASKIENPLRFQGQYHDEETGLHYNRFRYYSPQEGCFIHQDPIRLSGGRNLTAYAPNPVAWIDPWGLAGCAFVDEEGTLNLKNKFEPGSDEDLALQQHVDDWNEQIQQQGGSMTRQTVTPAMRSEANDAAQAARDANPSLYPKGMAAGPTPDVGWGGDPQGPINPLPENVNRYVEGATQAVPVGTTYNSVVLY